MNQTDLPGTPLWVSAASRVIRWLPAGRYRAANWIARRRAPAFWAALPADLGRLAFRCDLRDPLMREVCLTGRYEPQETALLQRLLQPGMTFVDVGANWGYFTLVAAQLVGHGGRVLSIEADPIAARTVEANVARNGLSCVTVLAMAASDDEGTVKVRRYGGSHDESSNFGVALVSALDADARALSLDVPARTLDVALDSHGVGRVDLLKMDIEGAEARALAGLAAHFRARAVDRMIIELHPGHLRNQGTRPHAIISFLQSFGYDGWLIDHSPAAHRRSASRSVSLDSMLTPLTAQTELGDWPHVLFARRGLESLDVRVASAVADASRPAAGSRRSEFTADRS